MEAIVNKLIWAVILQGLLLGSLFILSRKRSSTANKLLGFFLLAFVLEALTNVPLSDLGGYSTNGYFSLPEAKLLLPVLLLHYMLEKLGQTARYRHFLRAHYFMAFGFLTITLFNVLLFLFQGKDLHQAFDFHRIEAVFMIMQYYAFFLTIAAIVISIREMVKYRSLVKNAYSDLDLLQIRWLWTLILGIVPIVVFWGLELIRIAAGGRGMSSFVSLTWLLIIVFIYFISFKAYQIKDLLENAPLSPEKEEKEQTCAPRQGQNDYPDLGSELTSFMESSNIYLRHNLTLYDLSKAMEVSPRLISGCINQNLGNNFVEWVNGFRVEAAIAKLQDPAFDHLSVEGIGLESGFQSRSAMYAAFKKQTGYSPGHFRQ
ncbi:MAG: AraC family transcriptional regulator [Bacteroidetes bacterium]|jgi:AraC-like DNA-binding protein|nr:MAG: AraC family transcriptional regulator [Bacteroidota bacterium]UCE70295.1 MAG: AraC family transcriptional regulator [Flavobacteriaceae bacterium]